MPPTTDQVKMYLRRDNAGKKAEQLLGEIKLRLAQSQDPNAIANDLLFEADYVGYTQNVIDNVKSMRYGTSDGRYSIILDRFKKLLEEKKYANSIVPSPPTIPVYTAPSIGGRSRRRKLRRVRRSRHR